MMALQARMDEPRQHRQLRQRRRARLRQRHLDQEFGKRHVGRDLEMFDRAEIKDQAIGRAAERHRDLAADSFHHRDYGVGVGVGVGDWSTSPVTFSVTLNICTPFTSNAFGP